MRPNPAFLLCIALGLLAPVTARAADWYLYWTCVGQCDGYGGPDAGGSGRFGPYASEDDCRYEMNHTLVIPPDSLFRYYCYDETPAETGPATSGPVYVPDAPSQREAVTLTSLELGVLGGPGWAARDDLGANPGQGTLGVDFDARTGPRYFGGSIQLGVQGTRLALPALGERRSWFVAPGGIGLVLSPKLFAVGDGSFWLDAGATAVGFLAFGCDDCGAPVFAKNWGFGYALRGGFDVMFDDESGLSVEVVVPRYHIGSAVPGDLELASPTWLVRVAMVGRPVDGITF